MPTIAITTDFGIKDGNVGVMKGVIWGICPAARIADVSHVIGPQNPRGVTVPARVRELRAHRAADGGDMILSEAVMDGHLPPLAEILLVADELIHDGVQRHLPPKERSQFPVGQEDRIVCP